MEWTRQEAQGELDRIRNNSENPVTRDAVEMKPEGMVYAYGNDGRRMTRLTKILTNNFSQRKAVQEIVKRILLSFVCYSLIVFFSWSKQRTSWRG